MRNQIFTRTLCNLAMALALFICAQPAQAWTFHLLHTFLGSDGRGATGIVLDKSTGNIYGTTELGGDTNEGVVFSLARNNRYKVLHDFTGGKDGGRPSGQLVEDPHGNFYGTGSSGGNPGCQHNDTGCGVIYKLTHKGAYRVLHSFLGGPADGAIPEARLIRDSDTGDLYGTTLYGGAADQGTIFRLSEDGSFKVLYSFLGGPDGSYPHAGVAIDAGKNIYGTTVVGGDVNCNCGTVFKLSSTGQKTVLYTFTSAKLGYPDRSTVILDGAGNLYGTGSAGGRNIHHGSLFKVTPHGAFDSLIVFRGGNGSLPEGDLLLDPSGTIFGTTSFAGDGGYGTVFQLDSDGKASVIQTFNGDQNGAGPETGVIEDEAGNLYGTTFGGGFNGNGTMFKLTK